MAASVMAKFQSSLLIAVMICILAACGKEDPKNIQRPKDVWAFRSVLDKQARMLTLALDSACYLAYDLTRCTIYKAWKGGVLMEGAAYTDKKEVQPTSWGTPYFTDSLQQFTWSAEYNEKNDLEQVVHKGHVFQDNQIYLKFDLILLR